MSPARDPKFNFTFQPCPGSGQPPYQYNPERKVTKVNPATGRPLFARALCPICKKEKGVNVSGVLRQHQRKVQL